MTVGTISGPVSYAHLPVELSPSVWETVPTGETVTVSDRLIAVRTKGVPLAVGTDHRVRLTGPIAFARLPSRHPDRVRWDILEFSRLANQRRADEGVPVLLVGVAVSWVLALLICWLVSLSAGTNGGLYAGGFAAIALMLVSFALATRHAEDFPPCELGFEERTLCVLDPDVSA